jgi:thioredoxin-related protein
MKARRGFWLGVLVLSCLSGWALSPKTAQDILTDAANSAAAEHKILFFEFGASWCSQCRRLEAFLSAPENAPIVHKYFVLAGVNVQEKLGKHPELDTPGAQKLLEGFGGMESVPFIVFVDAKGKGIVTSNRLVPGKSQGDNIGYPDAPEEIDWFMRMLKKGVPTMSAEEAKTLETWLKQKSSSH